MVHFSNSVVWYILFSYFKWSINHLYQQYFHICTRWEARRSSHRDSLSACTAEPVTWLTVNPSWMLLGYNDLFKCINLVYFFFSLSLFVFLWPAVDSEKIKYPLQTYWKIYKKQSLLWIIISFWHAISQRNINANMVFWKCWTKKDKSGILSSDEKHNFHHTCWERIGCWNATSGTWILLTALLADSKELISRTLTIPQLEPCHRDKQISIWGVALSSPVLELNRFIRDDVQGGGRVGFISSFALWGFTKWCHLFKGWRYPKKY